MAERRRLKRERVHRDLAVQRNLQILDDEYNDEISRLFDVQPRKPEAAKRNRNMLRMLVRKIDW